MRFTIVLTATLGSLQGLLSSQDLSFSRDVLPILSDRCFQCHGPDAQARKSDLRLDDRASVFANRNGKPAVVAGRPDKSELIRRIESSHDDIMPPRESKLSLSKNEIKILTQWIEAGAPWSQHWSFIPPAQKILPRPNEQKWSRNEIDAFILSRLEEADMAHAKEAKPTELIRRVSLDLTGLPPTDARLRSFIDDPSDANYLRIVDELIASPHYGERMAWPWLEATRYADTDGYQADPTRTAWPWRDWLVQSLNANMPFDQFTREVLAGDLIKNATPEQRLATGLLRNNAHNGEGGRIAEETRIENVFDRTETVATIWMGMTFECARCHDHKFDPVSQRDYYRLFAFFNQTSETGGARSGAQGLAPTMSYLGNPKQRHLLANIEESISRLEQKLSLPDAKLDQDQHQWEQSAAREVTLAMRHMQPSVLGQWSRSKTYRPSNGNKNSMFAERFDPERQSPILSNGDWQIDAKFVDGKPLQFEQGEYTIYLHRQIRSSSDRRISMSFGSDDAIKVWCNGDLILANNVRRGVLADQERAEATLRKGNNDLLIKIVNTGGAGGAYFRRIREAVVDYPMDVTLALAADKRTPGHNKTLRRHFRRKHVNGYRKVEHELENLITARNEMRSAGLVVSVMDQLPKSRRRTTSVLQRGSYQQPREAVRRGTPSFLPRLTEETIEDPSRMTLANWLVSGRHPLTARVTVNRAWQTFFGRGLVATSEDFGRQGDRPSHPELLDWLARKFVASGWDLKLLHKLIVTSATYRQASSANESAFVDDPSNIMLARSSRHRLPAWMLRDQALALSGNLSAQLGGAPVRPYQPSGIWAEATFGTIRYQPSTGEDIYKRSLYVFWRRIVGPTVFFDTQGRQQCVVNRSVTNTPLHALTTMNETGFVESARGLATRAWHAHTNNAERITWLFEAATARKPTDSETNILKARFANSRNIFLKDQESAKSLLQVGNTPVAPGIPPADLAAFSVLASVILNLDEVLTRP
jgi:hypothetical protein